ncbi:hypothetical protein FRC11_010182, partial [Ceratobasidium sp. 423]
YNLNKNITSKKTELKKAANKALGNGDHEMRDAMAGASPSTSTADKAGPSMKDIEKMILKALAKDKASKTGKKTLKHRPRTPKKPQANLGKGNLSSGPCRRPLNPPKGGQSGGQTSKAGKHKASTQAANTAKKSKNN